MVAIYLKFLFGLIFGITGSLGQSRQQFQSGIYRDTRRVCFVEELNRRDCGYAGINRLQCQRRSCCFNNANTLTYGIPECFFGNNDRRSITDIIAQPRPTSVNGLGGPNQGSIFNQNNQLDNRRPTRPPSPIDGILMQLDIDADPTEPPTKLTPTEATGQSSQCSIAAAISDSPSVQKALQERFGCTGNEAPASQQELAGGASSLFQNILASSTAAAASNAAATTTVATTASTPSTPSTPGIAQSLISSLLGGGGAPTSSSDLVNELLGNNEKQVGGLKPNFGPLGGAIDTGPPTEPPICATIKTNAQFKQIAPALGCKVDLFEYLTSSLIGPIIDRPTSVATPPGAIDPSKIPARILLECIEKRDSYSTCNRGYYTNILTDTECFNLGCIPFEYKCFRCLLVPKEAIITIVEQQTCAVAEADQVTCTGFSNVALISLLSNTYGRQTTTTPSPTAGLGGLASLLGLGGSSGTSGGSDLAALLPLLARSGNISTTSTTTANPLAPVPRNALASLLPLLGGGATGGGDLGTLGALSALGGLGGGGTSSLGALGALSGIDPNTLTLLQLLGGGTSSAVTTESPTVDFEERYCKSKDCCYKKATGIQAFLGAGGTCYQKGKQPISSSGDCSSTRLSGGTCDGAVVGAVEDRPWHALIFVISAPTVKCSGVVICQNWILTVASCLVRIALTIDNLFTEVPNIQTGSLQVRTGKLDTANTGGVLHIVEQIVPHPQYNFQQNFNNIAAIRIRRTLISATFAPACMPSLGDFELEDADDIVNVDGFGDHSVPGNLANLNEVQMKVMSTGSCQGAYPNAVPNSGVFCATAVTTGSDTCYGDGGAPALHFDSSLSTFTVVGLAFAGSEECDGSKPSLFTSISRYRIWILDTTNGCCSLPGQY